MNKKVIDIEVGVQEKLAIIGGSGRIADIIGDKGYENLINLYAKQTEESENKIALLHSFVGWMIDYAKQGYKGK